MHKEVVCLSSSENFSIGNIVPDNGKEALTPISHFIKPVSV